MTVTTRAASLTVPPVTVKSYLNKDTNNYPNPIIIYAEVSQGFLPVIGANVTATVEPASGTAVKLELYDTGSGADLFKNDGIYSRYFTSFNGDGRYNIKIHVQGKDKTVRRVRRYSQALYVPGYVENGVIKMNTPRPEVSEDEIQPDIGHFSRIASGGSFVLAGAPPSSSSPPPDVFPPCKITDLEAQLEDDEFLLSWTAPGNDYDIGKAGCTPPVWQLDLSPFGGSPARFVVHQPPPSCLLESWPLSTLMSTKSTTSSQQTTTPSSKKALETCPHTQREDAQREREGAMGEGRELPRVE
ncbi:UNVERIFIED_CONTAM: hypothetical protein K2H54_043528 [Gekko kuhli]